MVRKPIKSYEACFTENREIGCEIRSSASQTNRQKTIARRWAMMRHEGNRTPPPSPYCFSAHALHAALFYLSCYDRTRFKLVPSSMCPVLCTLQTASVDFLNFFNVNCS